MGKIRTMIVDDDWDWIMALKSYIEARNDIEICEAVVSGEEALKKVTNSNPDIILMDIVLGENIFDGVNLTRRVIKKCTAKIIMLTSFNNSVYVRDSFDAGAVNYILKEDYRELPDLIKKVYNVKTSFLK